jgi:hypothetical protein
MSEEAVQYPFLFSFRDVVRGEGFACIVVTNGRALATKEKDQSGKAYWFEGVNPGGVSGGEREIAGAYIRFRQAYTGVLFDLAADSAGVDDFRRRVQQLFDETNRTAEREWLDAVQDVKKGRLEARGLERQPADSRRYVEVFDLDALKNIIEPEPAVAA